MKQRRALKTLFDEGKVTKEFVMKELLKQKEIMKCYDSEDVSDASEEEKN